MKGKIYYNVKWKGHDQTSWEPRTTLIEDVPLLIDQYEYKDLVEI